MSNLKNKLCLICASLLPFVSLSSSSYFFVDDIDQSQDSWVLEEEIVIEVPKSTSLEIIPPTQLTSKSIDVGTETQDEGPEGPSKRASKESSKKETKSKKETNSKKDNNLETPTASASPSIPPAPPPKKKFSDSESPKETPSNNSVDVGTEADDEGPEDPSVKKTKKRSKWELKKPAPAAVTPPVPKKDSSKDDAQDYEDDDLSEYDGGLDDYYNEEDEFLAEQEQPTRKPLKSDQAQDKPEEVNSPWYKGEKGRVLLV